MDDPATPRIVSSGTGAMRITCSAPLPTPDSAGTCHLVAKFIAAFSTSAA
jgi:hypothetical protein